MTITLIVAKGQHNEIGANNDLMWHLPDDMAFFKKTTLGHPVVMGRKNYLSIPEKYRPLPQRTNIVLTSNPDLSLPDGVLIAHSVQEVLVKCRSMHYPEIFIIGGGQLYEQFLPHAHRLLVTEVYATFPEADTFFPAISKNDWKEVQRVPHPADERHAFAFDFATYERA